MCLCLCVHACRCIFLCQCPLVCSLKGICSLLSEARSCGWKAIEWGLRRFYGKACRAWKETKMHEQKTGWPDHVARCQLNRFRFDSKAEDIRKFFLIKVWPIFAPSEDREAKEKEKVEREAIRCVLPLYLYHRIIKQARYWQQILSTHWGLSWVQKAQEEGVFFLKASWVLATSCQSSIEMAHELV